MSPSSVNTTTLDRLLSQYNDMATLYLRCLELGDKAIICKEEELEKIVDERNRIFNRIGSIQERTEALVEEISPLTLSVKARIEEAKNNIRDLLPKFRDQLFKMNKNFIPKLKEKREEIVATNKKSRAAMAYLKSPGNYNGRA